MAPSFVNLRRGGYTLKATIANGAALSDGMNIGPGQFLAIEIPDAWDSAAITFQVALESTATYYNLYAEDGTEVTIPAMTGTRSIAVPLEVLAFAYVKIRSGTAGTPVNQTGGKTINLVVA